MQEAAQQAQAEGTSSIELDIAYHGTDTLEDSVTSFLMGRAGRAPLPLSWRVKQENGPGEGWPVVEFTGPDAAIEALAWRYGIGVFIGRHGVKDIVAEVANLLGDEGDAAAWLV